MWSSWAGSIGSLSVVQGPPAGVGSGAGGAGVAVGPGFGVAVGGGVGAAVGVAFGGAVGAGLGIGFGVGRLASRADTVTVAPPARRPSVPRTSRELPR